MERFPRTSAEADKLLELSSLLRDAAFAVKEEWEREDFTDSSEGQIGGLGHDGQRSYAQFKGHTSSSRLLPSHRLWEAEKTIEAVSGSLVELVAEPYQRIQQVSTQYMESRSLYIAAERNIPDILAESGEAGLSLKVLGERTRIEARKLGRILRTLCSIHVFKEVAQDVFANNRISSALMSNPALRAYVLLFGMHSSASAEHLPRYLLGPKGSSYKVDETAFQNAVGTDKAIWEWMAEKVSPERAISNQGGYSGVPDLSNFDLTPDQNGQITRPELANFSLGMVGGGNASGTAHAYDFPWASLGDAVVVDVGGGIGGFVLQLYHNYPQLKFIVQDRPEVVERGQQRFLQEAPDAVPSGRVRLMAHDFFKLNPIKYADVYWLRGILHDWSDEYCITILKALKESMGPNSRILICDPVMNTTLGCDEIQAAPAPLLANYGYNVRYCHNRDLVLMSTMNGVERTPKEFKELFNQAGLRLEKFWGTRSMVGITEARLL